MQGNHDIDDVDISDDELLVRWLQESDGSGAVSVRVFLRYRESVRIEIEKLAGLSPVDANQWVLAVFGRARRRAEPRTPLPECLIATVREVAGELSSTGGEDRCSGAVR